MRRRLFLIFALANIVLSCASHHKSPGHFNKKISICSEGWVRFVRSYSFLMSMYLSEKEKDRMYDKTAKENPFNNIPADSRLKKRFEELGFMSGDEVLLEKFRYMINPDSSFSGSATNDINYRFVIDSLTGRENKLIVFLGNDSSQIRTGPYMDLKYAFLDIIPGGNKEIVMLIEGYVSNNDLYDFEVFEIKTDD